MTPTLYNHCNLLKASNFGHVEYISFLSEFLGIPVVI